MLSDGSWKMTEEVSAPDDKTITVRSKQLSPGLPDALGKVGFNMRPITPDHLAASDPLQLVAKRVVSDPIPVRH